MAKGERENGPWQDRPLHLVRMLRYEGVTEDPPGSNTGPHIDEWREEFGFDFPVPWCGVFASVKSRRGLVERPVVWSARAKDFAVAGSSWKLSDIIYRRYVPRPGDYRVKTRRGGNHVDIFVQWDDETQTGVIIGGNVSRSVRVRPISLQRMIADGTTHVTQVEGHHRYDPAGWIDEE